MDGGINHVNYYGRTMAMKVRLLTGIFPRTGGPPSGILEPPATALDNMQLLCLRGIYL